MRLTSIILIVVLMLVVFAVGGGAGIFYQTQKDAPQIEKSQTVQSTAKFLSSKLISSITAFGQVEKIEGRNITLSYSGDSITVKFSDNAQFVSFIADSKGKISQQRVNLGDIKKGDNISVNLNLLPDGTFASQTAMILPPPSALNTNSVPIK